MDRPLPDLRHRFRANRNESVAETGFDALNAVDLLDSPVAAVAVAAAVLLFFLILLPLIGLAFELLLVLIVIWSGLAARVVLGRPWIVEAVDVDDSTRSIAFGVKGWRGSSQAIEEVKRAIATSGPPERISEGEPVRPLAATRR
jgi:hypothetical protein